MIQDILPHQYDPAFRPRKPEDRDFLLHYQYNKVMLAGRGDSLVIPTVGDLKGEVRDLEEKAEYLFSIDERAYYMVRDMSVPEIGDYHMEGLQIFRDFSPQVQAFAGITGSQLYRWKESRRFCGCCGGKMRDSKKERALVCPNCGQTEYPKISPAVIVAVKNGDKVLMSRYAASHSSYRHYALIAGFVEIGETFEDCVRREVMEEVGLKVKNIRYYKSQPWAFSDTVMIGFTADLDGDDVISLEEEELAEAGWYTRDQVVEYGTSISVGHEMMAAFKQGKL